MTDSALLTDLPSSPGLQLDKRQRAMLREMGIRVWLPVQTPVAVAADLPVETPQLASQDMPIATNSVAADARETSAKPRFDSKSEPEAASAPAPAAPSRAARPQTPTAAVSEPQSQVATAAGEASWHLGQAQTLYTDSGPKDSGARWLVLMEAPLAALQNPAFNPFEGDVGKLLDNMLRATRLHKAASVVLAPLVRQAGEEAEGTAGADLPTALAELVSSARPDVMLVMGRLAAQALLQSREAFGRLRGQVHQLHGAATIVTLDAAYLLRTPLDKAKAWDDLCLAMSLVNKAG